VQGSVDCFLDHLEKAAGQLEAALAEQCQVDTELVALWTSAALVQDLVLGDVDVPSSLATSRSMVEEEVKS
jgi:hypothetical protein